MNILKKLVTNYSEIFLLMKGLVEAFILIKLFNNIDLRIYTYPSAFAFGIVTLFFYERRAFDAENIVKVFVLSSAFVIILFLFLAIVTKYALIIPAIYVVGFFFFNFLMKLKKPNNVYLIAFITFLIGIASIEVILPKINFNRKRVDISFNLKKHKLSPVNFSKNEQIEFNGRVTVLDFWATWCQPCIKQFDELELLHEKYRSNNNISIYALNTSYGGDNLSKVHKFVAKSDFNFDVLHDSAGVFSKSLLINVLPTTIVIDQYGIVRYKQEGLSPKGRLIKEISQILEEIESGNLKK